MPVKTETFCTDAYIPNGQIGPLDLSTGCYTFGEVLAAVASDLTRRGTAAVVLTQLSAPSRTTVRGFLRDGYGVVTGPRELYTAPHRTPNERRTCVRCVATATAFPARLGGNSTRPAAAAPRSKKLNRGPYFGIAPNSPKQEPVACFFRFSTSPVTTASRRGLRPPCATGRHSGLKAARKQSAASARIGFSRCRVWKVELHVATRFPDNAPFKRTRIPHCREST
jgi:hypothetical protein